MTFEFQEFDKIARWRRELIITEKLDGTNGQIAWFQVTTAEGDAAYADKWCLRVMHGIHGPMALYAGSRNRWLAPEGTPEHAKGCDNFAFAQFVAKNAEALYELGPGRHYGEWYGLGIQRNYGLTEKRFALFNTSRWADKRPPCCEVVSVLPSLPDAAMDLLSRCGSQHVSGFAKPEGIVIYHTASRTCYKQTFEKDAEGKGT